MPQQEIACLAGHAGLVRCGRSDDFAQPHEARHRRARRRRGRSRARLGHRRRRSRPRNRRRYRETRSRAATPAPPVAAARSATRRPRYNTARAVASLAPGRPRLSPDAIVPSGARDPAKRDCCVLVGLLAAVQGSGLLVPGCSETAPSATSAPGTEPRPIRQMDASTDQTEAEPASGGSNAMGATNPDRCAGALSYPLAEREAMNAAISSAGC